VLVLDCEVALLISLEPGAEPALELLVRGTRMLARDLGALQSEASFHHRERLRELDLGRCRPAPRDVVFGERVHGKSLHRGTPLRAEGPLGGAAS
jgi:hypothetical protein